MQAITNEKHSPEILPYRGDLVDELQQQIEKQVGIISERHTSTAYG